MRNRANQYSCLKLFVVLGCAATVAACGSATTSSGSGSSAGDDTPTTDTTTSTTVPGDLVVSSPTAASSSANSNLAVAKLVQRKAVPSDPAGENGVAPTSAFQEKREALQALLAASGECSFTPRFEALSPPQCYGPSLQVCDHPDADTSDADCTGPSNGGMTQTDDLTLPVGDLGLWSEYEGATGEACAAAKMNYLIDRVAMRIDNVVNLFGAVACAGKKASIALPAVGETVDLLAAVTANISVNRMTISAVSLQRLADDASGDAVYQSTISMSIDMGNSQTESATLILRHIPLAADNSLYRGKLSMVMRTSTSIIDGNCAASGLDGITRAGVITYEKTATDSLVYQLDHANFCGADTNPLDSNNDIDPADKLVIRDQGPAPSLAKVDEAAANADGWGGDWNHGIFRLNPATGTGVVAYAWQAGPQDGYSRVLDVSVASGSDGSASGTAYFGYGPDVAADDVGSISGFFCNWAGPNSRNDNGAPSAVAQRQVLTRAASATVFASDSSQLAITYAPTNSCSLAAGTTMTYTALDQDDMNATVTLDNNHTTSGEAVTSTLIPLTSVDFTLPTPPTTL